MTTCGRFRYVCVACDKFELVIRASCCCCTTWTTGRCPIPWCDPCGTDHSPDWSRPGWSGWPFAGRKALGRHWRTEFCICVRGRPRRQVFCGLVCLMMVHILVFVYSQNRQEKKKKHHVRLEAYHIMVLVVVKSRICLEWRREKKKKRQIISFEDILIPSEILLVSISDEWRRQLKRESFQITFQKFVKILMGEKNYFY